MISVVPPAPRLGLWLAALLGLFLLMAAVGLRGYQMGRADGAARAEAALAQAQAAHAQAQAENAASVARANARALNAESRAARRIAEITRRTPERVEQAKEALHEAPAFATAVRPGALDRLRLDELAELEREARRSAELSHSILPALPGASGVERSPTRSDGDRGHREPGALGDLHRATQCVAPLC